MDSDLSRNKLIVLVVGYWNTIEYKIASDDSSEDESNNSECCYPSSMKNKDSDMDVDEEEKSPNKISK